MFSDKSHFFVQGQGSQHVCRSKKESVTRDHIEQHAKHPEKKMFWGCFSYFSVDSFCSVEGMMRSPQYIKVLKNRLLPEMKKRSTIILGSFNSILLPAYTNK